jgi:hypothetical protein
MQGSGPYWDKKGNFILKKENQNIWMKPTNGSGKDFYKLDFDDIKKHYQDYKHMYFDGDTVCLLKIKEFKYTETYKEEGLDDSIRFTFRAEVIEKYKGKIENNIILDIDSMGEVDLDFVSTDGYLLVSGLDNESKNRYDTMQAYTLRILDKDIQLFKQIFHLKPLYSTLQSSNPKTLSFENYQKSIQPFLPPKNDFEKKVVRNLPFATRGYIFQDKKVQAFYENIEWYKPNKEYKSNINDLSDTEKEWIQKYEGMENKK